MPDEVRYFTLLHLFTSENKTVLEAIHVKCNTECPQIFTDKEPHERLSIYYMYAITLQTTYPDPGGLSGRVSYRL